MSQGKRVVDNIYHIEWPEDNTRACIHPAVLNRYHCTNACIVPVFKCNVCKCAIHVPHTGITECGYKRGE